MQSEGVWIGFWYSILLCSSSSQGEGGRCEAAGGDVPHSGEGRHPLCAGG